MKPENKYKKYKYLFLISTFAGIAGLYIAYKFDSAAAKNISYILFGAWFILALYVRYLIIRDKKNIKK
ncbi:MAG: hypothetical protein PHI20_03865 [Endomicrobiaceae bacterium]|jgi:ABC-type Mn2+/Zn2+ transport system permease subunit|nr:hypothetical protein [Endomicrobiaceae bacterium]MDD3730153.1 hypothetical protein [Endomicrobiaceae bacterium]MDD4165925.1 hypothetical protein [Endomicrobiaceae bacterium]